MTTQVANSALCTTSATSCMKVPFDIQWKVAKKVDPKYLWEKQQGMMSLSQGPVYLSFDIDAIDPGFCPGNHFISIIAN